ncbi:P-loop containing nucleoside triphosphate hydrolase protein [Lentithecium fluviatile CBS 122367]|uniref:P-loop containing nucleoside triphosphate hydrolase protein n=1 Tax=Lentithecium fluviatile CBS 122367 TaxID=1168545 RepID=A0A6G1J0E8_9PLEO|nr:P-loop containing nucleoside triphosphate hydrolase protein [Lentithecium fluviatile CBS 122367]
MRRSAPPDQPSKIHQPQMSRVCQSDASFGPGIGSCRGGFDLTLVFEESALGLLPQAALLLLAPIRLATLQRRRDKVAKSSHLGFLKTVAGTCYVASSIALLAIWSETEAFKTKWSIASASLEFLGSLFIVTLSRLEHSRAVRPSHLLQFFLLVLLLCNAVRLRTLFLMEYPVSLVTLASVHAFLTGLLLLLESLDKRELFFSDQDRRLPPEETIGLFGKRLFWYLNGLFREGYRKILKPADLHSIDADLASRTRAAAFQNTWSKQDKTKGAPLARTILKILWVELLSPVIPRYICTTLSQPYLITAIIRYVEDRDSTSSENVGYGLIAAFALNYAILAIASSRCAQEVARFSTKLRSCMISLIYEMTLITSSKDVDLGAATVLMNVDVEKVLSGCRYMHEIWAAVISTGVALYILYTHLGAAIVAPFVTILTFTALSTWIGKYMRARQLPWAAATQARVTAISYVVGRMKGVRMLGLSDTVFRMLTNLRELEVAAHRHIRKILVWVLLISNVIFQVTTLTTYVTFAIIMLSKHNGTGLDFNTLYGSLSALKLVASPLMVVLQIIPALQTSLASLEGIENFLRIGTIERDELLDTDSAPISEGQELPPVQQGRSDSSVLSMEDATFAVDEQPLVFDVTTNFQPGSFTMIIGNVGSGKSIFLRSLAGETKLLSGSFRPPSSGTAYCDQAVWLRNATIRENIIGESDFNHLWYSRVISACGLWQDLEEMKRGDQTPIGSQGISLSGGQKNRLTLARALYARKPILVIDDMLAGLDNMTEKLVFGRVFGRHGLLRKSNATVVLATHATYYARHADRILVFADGRIAEQGTFQELAERNVDFQAFDSNASIENHEIESADDTVAEVESSSKLLSQLRAVEEDEGDEDDDDAARRSGDRRSLTFFLRAIGPFHVSLYWVLLMVATVATQIQFLWLKWWVDSDDSSKSASVRNLYLFIIITAINIALYFIYLAHFALWFVPRLSLNLHASQLTSLMYAKFSWIVSTDIGSITNRFSQDIVLVDNQLQFAWINVTSEILLLISSIAIIVVATPPVAGTIPLLAGIGYCIQRVYLRTSRQVRLMDLEAKAPLCTHFLESLAGLVTIRAFGWTSAYRKKNSAHLDQSQVPFYLLFAIQNWLNLVLELMVAGLITVICGLAVGLRSKVDPGYLGLALVSAMDLGWNFRIIILAWTELETSLSAVTRIRQFATTPSESQESTQEDSPEGWPMHGSVIFKNFAASYTERGESVLKGINLNIKAGEKIGVCGRTGSGKSSLVATLFGLLHRQEGELLIDDLPTTSVSLPVLRSNIIVLPQEPFFLRGTVRHNLAPWGEEERRLPVSDERMKDALRQVQLWDKLSAAAEPQQSALDVSLDNVDSLLSQGERQLFCLARAILMDGKIVVLDEATSSVDAQTDALMQRILRTAFANRRTIIAIAHRLDTILDFDRVVVMDAGYITEVGEPGRLLQTQSSLFRVLVESQGMK